MADPRLTKLAQVLVQYSMELKPGDQFILRCDALAEELSRAVYKEAILAGAHVTVQNSLPGLSEIFYKHANDDQLEHISPVQRLIIEEFDAMLQLGADYNTRELSNINPKRMGLVRKAQAELFKIGMERMSRRELKWC